MSKYFKLAWTVFMDFLRAYLRTKTPQPTPPPLPLPLPSLPIPVPNPVPNPVPSPSLPPVGSVDPNPVDPNKPIPPDQGNPDQGNPPSNPDEPSPIAQQLVVAINELRAAGGLKPLTWEKHLTAAAKKHSYWMCLNNKMDHTGENGSTVGQRITAEGYKARSYGECIASGYKTVAAVVEGWRNSPGHYAIIMGNYTDVGFGVANAGKSVYWTADFGTPSTQSQAAWEPMTTILSGGLCESA